jgi:hypothetical protein
MFRLFDLLLRECRHGVSLFVFAAGIVCAGLLAGCATTPAPEPVVTVPKPPPRTPVVLPEEAAPPPVAEPETIKSPSVKPDSLPVVRHPADEAASDLALILSGQLGLEESAVTVIEAAESVWPDACLGFPAEGEICAQILTRLSGKSVWWRRPCRISGCPWPSGRIPGRVSPPQRSAAAAWRSGCGDVRN